MTRKPTAPDSLPKYLSEGVPVQDDGTLRDIITYCESLLDYRAEATPDVPVDAEIVDETDESGVIVKEYVRCGKDNCHCTEDQGHGPYLYAYWWEDGTTRSEYVGKPE